MIKKIKYFFRDIQWYENSLRLVFVLWFDP